MSTTEPNGTNHGTELAPATGGAIESFASEANFTTALRMAKLLASSTMVPEIYQGNLPNCVIAIELAGRIGASVLSVMQHMAPVHGKPTWSSQFLVATVNSSKRFKPLRFRFTGKEGTDSWGCRAWTVAIDDPEVELVGPPVSIAMAKAEGWYGRKGSKWQNMPELMMCYRAAGFWTRIYAPELSIGMTTEEAGDIYGGVSASANGFEARETPKNGSLEDALRAEPPPVHAPLPEPVLTPTLAEELAASIVERENAELRAAEKRGRERAATFEREPGVDENGDPT